MSTQQIIIGDQTHEIETLPVTVLFSNAHASMGPDYKYPGRYVLDAFTTRLQAEYLDENADKLHPEFEKFWRLFFEATTPRGTPTWPLTADVIKTIGTGGRHLIGLIDMLLKLDDLKIPTVVRHPESFMHPGWAVALGDLFIHLSKRGEAATPA